MKINFESLFTSAARNLKISTCMYLYKDSGNLDISHGKHLT